MSLSTFFFPIYSICIFYNLKISEKLKKKNCYMSLANYQIKNPIGRGAGSFVCRILNRQTKLEYAAKIIQKSNNKDKLLNEIGIHKQLKHDNIVELIETLEDNDNYYLIMHLCDEELYQMVKRNRLSEQQIRVWGKQLTEGLKYLHDLNIIHRDLKLGNLLISGSTLKIADFGLAVKLSDEEDERNTLCGTPNYISPEVLNNQPYGKKVDLWSLGCCLYAMCMGKGPFEDAALGEVLRKVKLGEFEIPKTISSSFKDLLLNLINLDADQRYSINQILKHPFFVDKIYRFGSSDKIRNQSSSQIRQLLDMTPLVKQTHRQTNSMVQLDKQQIVKKLLFGLTTQSKAQKKVVELEQVPRFYLPKDESRKNSDNKENIKQECNVEQKSQQFQESPLKTDDLKPCKLSTRNGQLQIYDDGKFEMEVTSKKLIFQISEQWRSGVKSKIYKTFELPIKLQKFYLYSKQVCKAIRERNIKNKIQNDQGVFLIKNAKQGLTFEGQLASSKIKITHILNTKDISIQNEKVTKQVPLDSYMDHVDPSELYCIKIALKYLHQLQ
ncbi:hypothetical protein pb186bvf_014656 [Paramecium bursaria]